MKEYFKRLKQHPGKDTATMMTVLGFIAGASNKSASVWWEGGLFGMLFAGGLCWSIVLFSNMKN